jgi:hypothetical protein
MFFTRLKVSGNGREITCWREQPGRAGILHTIERRRLEGVVPRDSEGLGRMMLQIPFEDWLRLREQYPELASVDGKIKTRAYCRLMRSPESAPFRVRAKC